MDHEHFRCRSPHTRFRQSGGYCVRKDNGPPQAFPASSLVAAGHGGTALHEDCSLCSIPRTFMIVVSGKARLGKLGKEKVSGSWLFFFLIYMELSFVPYFWWSVYCEFLVLFFLCTGKHAVSFDHFLLMLGRLVACFLIILPFADHCSSLLFSMSVAHGFMSGAAAETRSYHCRRRPDPRAHHLLRRACGVS